VTNGYTNRIVPWLANATAAVALNWTAAQLPMGKWTPVSNLLNEGSQNANENQIEINCVGDGLGHFAVDCETMHQAGIGNELNIEMTFDQTAIPNLVRQLDNITKTFPIQGTGLNVVNE